MDSRVKRLTEILSLLYKNDAISISELEEHFAKTKKILQLDFKNYLIPLFNGKLVWYDKCDRGYKLDKNHLKRLPFSNSALATMAILKHKSREKYADKHLVKLTAELFVDYKDKSLDNIYKKSAVEKLDQTDQDILNIKRALEQKQPLKCNYNDKNRTIHPLDILNLDGFWYLLAKDEHKIKTFTLNKVKETEILDEEFSLDETDIKDKFQNAINAYFSFENDTMQVRLLIEKEVKDYFIRKPLNTTQKILQEHNDGSIELELYITNHMEIIPTIQQYIPHVKVIEPNELADLIKINVKTYYEQIYAIT